MASIRRTLSPAHHYQNGAVYSPLSLSSPSSSNKFSSSNGKPSSSSVAAFRSIAAAFSRKRKGLRRAAHRFLLFFLVGILLGAFPSSHVDLPDTPLRGEIVKNPPVNLQLDANGSESHAQSVTTVSLEVETNENHIFDYLPRKELIVVTPTYNRAMQAYFLNRLGQALRLVQPPLVWIVVETGAASTETAEILRKTGVMCRHLVCDKNLTDVKDRGVHQRNTALEHIQRHRLDGIVYFADDDNVYTVELFESLRQIRRFGTWPVAMLAPSKNKAILEGPVCNASQVIGWHTNEKSRRLRRFHVDMSGFAFNSTILWDPKRWQRPFPNPIRQLDTVKEGFQETTFIEQVVEDESQMEGIPLSCSKVLNWHLHLGACDLSYPKGWQLQKNLDVVLPIT